MNFDGIDLADVSKIEFAFSQNKGSTPLKVTEYPGSGTVKVGDGMVGVIWTPEETMLFEADKSFYADTRITMSDTEYQPQTPIVRIVMNATLFERG